LRVVKPEELTRAQRAAKVAARRRLFTTMATVGAALSLFGVAAAHVVIAQSQFELARLERQSTEAQARYDRLRLQVAELESPARIVAAAQERLGMVSPPQVTYLTPLALRPTASAKRASGGQATTAAAGPTEWSLLKPHLAQR
jgi:cell division protein FtsL